MEDNAVALHLIDQGPRELAIEKWHQHVAAVNEMNLGSERGEGAGIFAANGPRADHGHGLGDIHQVQQSIGVINSWAERKDGRANRRGACCNQNVVAANQHFSVVTGRVCLVLILRLASGNRPHPNRVRVFERRVSKEDVGVERIELLSEHGIQTAFHGALVPQEIANRRFSADRQVHSVEVSGPQPRQGHGRLAKRLAGDRPSVGPRAAEFMMPVDKCHGLAQYAGRRHPAETGGATTDDDQIILSWAYDSS